MATYLFSFFCYRCFFIHPRSSVDDYVTEPEQIHVCPAILYTEHKVNVVGLFLQVEVGDVHVQTQLESSGDDPNYPNIIHVLERLQMQPSPSVE